VSRARVLLRAKSGPRVGRGHVVRSAAVAEALMDAGAEPLLVLDDAGEARGLRARGLAAASVAERPDWVREPAGAAWLDGFVDWSAELRQLARRGRPTYLVENRTPAREFASFIVHPNLYDRRDTWEKVHADRVLAGPAWIPLARSVLAQPECARDLELLVTFGGSDPLRSTERVLAHLPAGLRVAVSIGDHMEARRSAIAESARHLAAELLPTGASLAPWMARARAAVTALGTTLYELAYLGTPALILANFAADAPVLARYGELAPFRALGLAAELDGRTLARALALELGALPAPGTRYPGLGDGARALAEHMLARANAGVTAA
jgi:spore coat polysaccharide biosynthesis predicted glycosyltransferase SpsG